jgi:hypothetical protein
MWVSHGHGLWTVDHDCKRILSLGHVCRMALIVSPTIYTITHIECIYVCHESMCEESPLNMELSTYLSKPLSQCPNGLDLEYVVNMLESFKYKDL